MPQSAKMVKFTEPSDAEETQERNGAAIPLAGALGALTLDTENGKAEKEMRGEEGQKKTRKNSLSKAPRDPRDAISPPIEPETPSVIDFDGLSRPSKLTIDLDPGLRAATNISRRCRNSCALGGVRGAGVGASGKDFWSCSHNSRVSW